MDQCKFLFEEFETILPSYNDILQEFTLTEDHYKVMIWAFELRFFNMNKEFMSYANSMRNDTSTMISTEQKFATFSKNDSPTLRDSSKEVKKEFWAQFLKDEIITKEPYFIQMIRGFNQIFKEKHIKISAKFNDANTLHLVLREFEKLKELLFVLIMNFYQDFIKKIVMNFKGIHEIYEEIRNILDDCFFSKENSFYPIIMKVINISSLEKRTDFEFELYNPLNMDLNYLEFDPKFKSLFTSEIHQTCIEILRDLKNYQTPRGKYENIALLKEFLIRELFDKYTTQNNSKLRIDTDQIISMMIYIICGLKEPDLINELIFMEELLSYKWKETYNNAYFYIAFKTAIHYLLKSSRLALRDDEKYDSNQSVFKVGN